MSARTRAQSNRRKVIIEVTRDFISIGERQNPCHCPVYYALKSKLDSETQKVGDVYRAGKVDLHREVKGQGDCEVVPLHLPREAKEFIKHFDSGKPVTPIDFEIEVPAAP